MSRHVKASSAGSTSDPAAALGSSLCGALTAHGVSHSFVGDGVSLKHRIYWAISLCWIAIAAMLLVSGSALANATHVPIGISFGPDGSAGTSFDNPVTVAVDQETHDIYVGDFASKGLYKFNENGAALSFTGSAPYIAGNKINGEYFAPGEGESQAAVDPHSGTIYVSRRPFLTAFQPSGEPAEFTAGPGAGSNQISGFGELLGLAVDQNGAVYAGDYNSGVSIFSPTGALLTAFTVSEPGNIAVDSQGNVYVNHWHGSVEKFVPSSFPVDAATTYTSAGTIDPNEALSVAVDPATNHLYVVERAQIAQYDEAGNRLGAFGGFGEPGASSSAEGLAVDGTSGRVLVSDRLGDRRVTIFGPTLAVPTPVTGEATNVAKESATLNGTVNPEGIELQSCVFKYGETSEYDQTTPCVESPAEIGAGEEPVNVHADLTGLNSRTTYHFRLVTTNLNGSSQGKDNELQTLSLPVVGNEHVTSVVSTEAVIDLSINPAGFPTTYHIDYGSSASYGQSTTESTVGSGKVARAMTSFLKGLMPATLYHWRIVATNSVGTFEGKDHTLTTFPTPGSIDSSCPNRAVRTGISSHLTNCRAYEMVSPLDKSNGDIISRVNFTGFATALSQSSVEGNSFTYSSYRAFAEPQGAPYTSQFLAHRDSERGWLNKSLNSQRSSPSFPPTSASLENEYNAFSSDLSSAWLLHDSEPTLDACAPPGWRNLYRRSANDTYEALSCAEPTVTAGNFIPELQGFSADSSKAIIRVGDRLTSDASNAVSVHEPGAPVPIYQLYLASAGKLSLVSVLPNGDASGIDSSVGTGRNVSLSNHNREHSLINAVSRDGTQVFWSTGGVGPGPIYLRKDADQEQSLSGACDEAGKACTIAVSGSESAYFHFGNPEGTKAFYTVRSGASAGNLYEFDSESDPPVSRLRGEKVEENILGSSNDLSRVYFVSTAASPQAQSEGAVEGKPNLYLDDGGATRFIATFSDTDVSNNNYGSPNLALATKRTARATSDGKHLVFMSDSGELSEKVADYDNTDAVNGRPNAEVYLYDAEADAGAGTLLCVSCNPTGQRPHGRQIARGLNNQPGPWGAATIPTFETQLYQPHYLSDNGKRVFFNAFDNLVLGDTNGRGDVYQWESPGSGGCEAASSTYSASAAGCISLISSGQSADDSEFLDATPDGSDVFFTTDESLLRQDYGLIDVYDAREGGGFPPPLNPPAACEGEACQGPLEAPNDPTPASAAFKGAGNVRERGKARCAKGKAHRKGRCVAKKHHKRSSKSVKHRANDNRRTGR